jgi:acyl-coenzyme A synthetase/AMP-(fatty) acid ligase
VYERDILQQEEGKGLNKGTPEHLAISDVSISMVVHYFDDLRTEEDYVNTYSKSHLSDSIVSFFTSG